MNLEIINNWVVVLPDSDFDTIGGMTIADIFEPAKHVSITGTVLVLPKSLVCHKRIIDKLKIYNDDPEVLNFIQGLSTDSMEFDTDIELNVGDRIAFRYIAKLNAITDKMTIDTEQGQAIIIPYDLIYAAIRDGQLCPINGWIFVEPMEYSESEVRAKHGGLMVDMKDERKDGIGIVRKVGKPLKAYLHDDYVDVEEIQEGQTILFRKNLKTPMEWAAHKRLNEGKYPFIRMQRKDILAIVTK